MHVTSEQQLDDGVIERHVTFTEIPGEVPGIVWTPAGSPGPRPLLLLGHPGGLRRMHPRLVGRARRAVADGFAAASIELPGSGERPRIGVLDEARADLRRTLLAGERVGEALIDRLVLSLIDQSVPEWRAALDVLVALPEIAGPAGYSGGIVSIGVRLAAVEPRIVAVGLFAGSFVPRTILDQARGVTIPVHVLVQWDDESNDRQVALDLFDALGSAEKTLEANMGGHTGVPAFAGDGMARFFVRHLNGHGARTV